MRRRFEKYLRDKIVKLDKSIKDYTKEELVTLLGHLKKSELMRSIILNERDFCSCNYERSQRSFWYSVVKPTLDKLGKLTANDETEEALSGWDKTLSKYLTELVKEGQLTYQDIMIVDESRRLEVPDRYTFSPYRNIVVCCEKDTIYSVVNDISSLLGCSCISTKGLNGFGAMETLMRRIKDNSNSPDEIIFLIMSDYDPVGYDIANTIREQASQMANALKMNCRIISKRIGIVPDQLTKDEVKNNQYTPKKKGIERWMKLTGGIDGKEKGLELDALEPDRIRKIFTENLKEYINSEEYFEHGKQVYLFGEIRDELEKYIDVIMKQVYEELESKVEMKKYDILDYVKNGNKFIPYEEIYNVDHTQLNNCVKKYFE